MHMRYKPFGEGGVLASGIQVLAAGEGETQRAERDGRGTAGAFGPAGMKKSSPNLLKAIRKAKPEVESGSSPNGFEVEYQGAGIPIENLPVFEETGEETPRKLSASAAAALAPRTLVAEEFRMLRVKVRNIGEERLFRCVGLISSAAGEGKTTMSLGLAAAMAQEPNRRVLLIEADLRKPSIDAHLGISHVPGLGDWLARSGNQPVPLRLLKPHGFFLLSAGTEAVWGENPERLGSERMATLLQAARRYFDFVVVDCPPLIPVADSVILQDMLDGFLFVVRARHAPRETILRALSHLKADRIQGVVFNDCHELLPSYFNFGYRQYGEYK